MFSIYPHPIEPDHLLSCAEPPSIEMFSIHPIEFQLLSVSNPAIIRRALGDGYHCMSNHLVVLKNLARDIADVSCKEDSSDYECDLEEVEARVDLFVDSLQHMARQTRFICYLFQRLPEDTLDQVAVQEQRCALDILWLQVDDFLPKAISRYRPYCFPNRWFAVLATNLSQLESQVTKLKDQLHIDLAHLNQPDATPTPSVAQASSIATLAHLNQPDATPAPSVAQASSIATRTRSHYAGPYGSFYRGR